MDRNRERKDFLKNIQVCFMKTKRKRIEVSLKKIQFPSSFSFLRKHITTTRGILLRLMEIKEAAHCFVQIIFRRSFESLAKIFANV